MAKIPIILEPGRADGKLATSGAIFDKNKGMFQSELNDIQDTLNSDNPNKPLSANQGKRLKELLDTKVIEIGAVPMDDEPIEGNIEHIVTSDGLAKKFKKYDDRFVVIINSWGNTSEITEVGQLYWSTVYKVLRRCTSLSPTQFIDIELKEDCIYIYKNKIYKYDVTSENILEQIYKFGETVDNLVNSVIPNLQQTKVIRISSWGNDTEITEVGQYQWSTVNKIIYRYDKLEPESITLIQPTDDTIYIYKNKIFVYDSTNDDKLVQVYEKAEDVKAIITKGLPQILSNLNTLNNTKVIFITSWGNSQEITAPGQYLWSIVEKKLYKCTSLDPETYITVDVDESTLYIYKNNIYKVNKSNSNVLVNISKILTVTSWGNSSEITEVGQIYYSTQYNKFRQCISIEPESYIDLTFDNDLICIFKNQLYKYDLKTNTIILLCDINQTIKNSNNINTIFSSINGIESQYNTFVGWVASDSNFVNGPEYKNNKIKCFKVTPGTEISLYKKSGVVSYYEFFKDFNGITATRIEGQTRQTISLDTLYTITVPENANYLLINVYNRGVLSYPDYVIIDGITIEKPLHFDYAKAVLETIEYNNNIPILNIDKNGFYITSDCTILPDSRYVITNPIPVSKGDYIEFYCSNNASLSPSIITECTEDGTPIKSLIIGAGEDNYTHKTFIEDDGFVVFSYNNTYPSKLVKVLSFKVMSLLYNLISTKQSKINIKTINGVSLLGEGDLTIAQGPQGIQGIQGPKGPQGNSGYSGAANELEVVNNITQGGETSALSAEQGKFLANGTDYNNLPLTPSPKHSIDAKRVDMDSSQFVSTINNSLQHGYTFHWDIVTKENRKAVDIKMPINSTAVTIYHEFNESFDATDLYYKFGIHVDESMDATQLRNITIFMTSGDNPLDSKNRCSYGIYTASDAEHSRTGSFYQCLNLYRVGSKGANFDITNIKYAGIIVNCTSLTDIKHIYLTDLAFAYPLRKPGVCIIVDNFAPVVSYMADYAASKGVKLNLSIIPYRIEQNNGSSATIEKIHEAKRQGHFIWNHTWSHVITAQTEAQIGEELIKSDLWLMQNGFSRGSKIYSNPSAFYDNIRYNTQFNSNAQAIYHHWTTYPGGENGELGAFNKFLLLEPVYPANRMALNICGLDWNNPNDKNLAYFIALAQAALDYKGIAVIGFHGTFWSENLDEEHPAGYRWKQFIDAIAAQENQYFYGIDDILEGRFY